MKTLMLILCCASLLSARENSITQASAQTVRPIGVMRIIDPAARRVPIRTDAGSVVTVVFDEATRCIRVAPGAKDLESAAPISASELTAGDRILARGRSGGDPVS